MSSAAVSRLADPAHPKVAILHYQAYPEIRVAKFARALADDGMRVTVLARDVVAGQDPRSKHPYAAGADVTAGIELRAVNDPDAGRVRRALTMPYYVNPLWRAAITRLLDDGCRLLIVHDFHLVLAATALARPRGVPVWFDMSENYPALLTQWREQEGPRRAVVNGVLRNIRLARRIERAGALAADVVSVVVPEHLPRVAALRGRGGAVVIDNTPVLADLGAPPGGPRAGGPGDALTVLYTGEIHRYRGIDTVIAAAALLGAEAATANSPRFRFSLVGTGKLLDELRRTANQGGVGDTVRFLGWQPDLRPFLADADIGIIPPHASEHYDVTMPNKLYDHMAFGQPVVVSDTPPMRRVVTTADCGVVFRAGDPADLARALRMLADPTTRRRLGENGRQAVRATYNWERDGSVVVDTARRLLDGRAHEARLLP